MFTPLQHQKDFSPFSSYNNFNITLNDMCENYFVGKRGEGIGESWAFTALRVASFFTVIIPILMALTYLMTSLLIHPDETKREMWNEKVYTPPFLEKGDYVKMLCRSGISETQYARIYFTRGDTGGGRIFGDGSFSHTEASLKQEDRILIVYVLKPSFSHFLSCNTDLRERKFASFEHQEELRKHQTDILLMNEPCSYSCTSNPLKTALIFIAPGIPSDSSNYNNQENEGSLG